MHYLSQGDTPFKPISKQRVFWEWHIYPGVLPEKGEQAAFICPGIINAPAQRRLQHVGCFYILLRLPWNCPGATRDGKNGVILYPYRCYIVEAYNEYGAGFEDWKKQQDEAFKS